MSTSSDLLIAYRNKAADIMIQYLFPELQKRGVDIAASPISQSCIALMAWLVVLGATDMRACRDYIKTELQLTHVNFI